MALAAIEVARFEFGLEIGRELGVAGFDDSEQAAWPSFDLTTYSLPVEAVMRMAFVGRYERMSAQRAYELGMISQIVDPPENLRDEAQALAEKIAKNSPAAMAATPANATGSTTCHNAPSGVQPSTRAASSNSRGTVSR